MKLLSIEVRIIWYWTTTRILLIRNGLLSTQRWKESQTGQNRQRRQTGSRQEEDVIYVHALWHVPQEKDGEGAQGQWENRGDFSDY